MAADNVAPFLNTRPITPAVSRNGSTAASPASWKQTRYSSTAGITPAAPLVGAVTTRPNDAFSSFTARAKQLTHLRTSVNLAPAAADGGDPGVGVRSVGASRAPASPEQRAIEPRGPADDAQPPGQRPGGVGAAVDALAHHRSRSAAARRRSPRRSRRRARSAGRPRGSSGPWPGSAPAGRRPSRSGRATGRARSLEPAVVSLPLLDHEAAADRIIVLGVGRAVFERKP